MDKDHLGPTHCARLPLSALSGTPLEGRRHDGPANPIGKPPEPVEPTRSRGASRKAWRHGRRPLPASRPAGFLSGPGPRSSRSTRSRGGGGCCLSRSGPIVSHTGAARTGRPRARASHINSGVTHLGHRGAIRNTGKKKGFPPNSPVSTQFSPNAPIRLLSSAGRQQRNLCSAGQGNTSPYRPSPISCRSTLDVWAALTHSPLNPISTSDTKPEEPALPRGGC